MRLIRFFFAAIFLAAVYDVAVCMITHANPLVSLVITVFAVSSWFLLDWLEGEYRRRSWGLDQRRAEERMNTWARRDRDGFGA